MSRICSTVVEFLEQNFYSDQWFSRNIHASRCLKSDCDCMLIQSTNCLAWYQSEFKLRKSLDKWSLQLTLSMWPHKVFSIFGIAKSRAMRAIRASVIYVPTRLRANVPKTCQLLIFTCQRVNKRASVPKVCQFFKLACQHGKSRAIFFNFACQKVCQLFN